MSKQNRPGTSQKNGRTKSLTEAIQKIHTHWKKKLTQRDENNKDRNKSVELTFIQNHQQESPKKENLLLKFWNSKRKQILAMVAAVTLVAVGSYTYAARQQSYLESLAAYEILLDGQQVGIVRDVAEYEAAVNSLQAEMKRLYGMEAYMPDNQVVVEINATDEELHSRKKMIASLKSQLGIKVKATALVVEGEPLVILPSEEQAKELLDEITSPYLDPIVSYLDVGFVENVELEETAADLSDIWGMEEALQFLETGTNETKIHEVQPGESSWLIADRNNMTVEDIEAANPGLASERLSIGQEINLIVPKPYLTVRTKEYAELAEPIPFETEEIPNDSLYEGDRRITVQGEDGFHEIKAHLVRENGKETDREILEEDRLAEPTTRMVAVGTKVRPPTMATGTFIMPTRGRLTSPFGLRGGSRHTGIDLAARTGTSVKAADAGRISYVGTRGAYGKLIIIDHENGYQTYYAHLSSYAVKTGERVHKDQQIGAVGNTGRSTGPHLHFEVRIDGVPVNPSKYVN